MKTPTLCGVIHLPPLPGSPRAAASVSEVARGAAADAAVLARAGFDAVIVENFGDAPFFAGRVPSVTVAAVTACALAVREAAPGLALGINVLRNDGDAAMSVAAVVGASFVRVNVLAGARVTDQGVVQGDAAGLTRLRRSLDAAGVAIWADVDVKHSSPLGVPRPVVDEVEDLSKRAMADVILVTGAGTGKGVDVDQLARVKGVAGCPVLVASGASSDALPVLARRCDGVVVGTALRSAGVPGGPIDPSLAAAFAAAFRAAFA